MYINVNKKWQPILDGAMIVFGCFIMGFAFSTFFEPNNISTGGFSGIAMMINSLLHKAGVKFINSSIIYLVMNLILYLIAVKSLGRRFAITALLGIGAFSGAMQIFALIPKFANFDLIISALFGGVTLGFGVGLVVRFGGSTGGSDMIACMVRKKHPKAHVGRIVVLIDIFVVAMTLVVYKNGVELLPYTIIALAINSFMVDYVIDGYKQAKAYTIITTKPKEVSQGIKDTLYRSCTMSNVKGMYDDSDKTCLVCLIGKYQVGTMKQIIIEIDPKAFVYAVPVHEIIGEWRTDSQIRAIHHNGKNEQLTKNGFFSKFRLRKKKNDLQDEKVEVVLDENLTVTQDLQEVAEIQVEIQEKEEVAEKKPAKRKKVESLKTEENAQQTTKKTRAKKNDEKK